VNAAEKLRTGLVIPAHPLALTVDRTLDERRQRALTRYYLAAGAGGIAVGVHTTQFAIREPAIGLLRPVLELAIEETRGSEVVKIAGICGGTSQAIEEAELAASLGYDAGLLSLGALPDATDAELLKHTTRIGSILPVIGFYLQPSVGGRPLSYRFWREFAETPSVIAIKIAPFNRYQTIDVIRAVSESGRAAEIALYTGNDDSILLDLLSSFELGGQRMRIAGGLLGHWAVWTRNAVCLLEKVKQLRVSGEPVPPDYLMLAHRITDANAALFDPVHRFRGCIPGIHEILRRQGLLAGRWCLDPGEDLSPGQSAEIDRVCRMYPELQDDDFVQEHIDQWLL
jgi:dihydrodipicolinate synthase/N-acetylneuraminate lyase